MIFLLCFSCFCYVVEQRTKCGIDLSYNRGSFPGMLSWLVASSLLSFSQRMLIHVKMLELYFQARIALYSYSTPSFHNTYPSSLNHLANSHH